MVVSLLLADLKLEPSLGVRLRLSTCGEEPRIWTECWCYTEARPPPTVHHTGLVHPATHSGSALASPLNTPTSTLCLYISKYLHIYTSAHLHIYTSTHLHIYISTYLHVYISTYLHIYISTSASTHISDHLCNGYWHQSAVRCLDPASGWGENEDKDINLTFYTTYLILTQHSTIQINPKSQT